MQLEDPGDLMTVHGPGELRVYLAQFGKSAIIKTNTITSATRIGERTSYISRPGRGNSFFIGLPHKEVTAHIRKAAKHQTQATNLQPSLPVTERGSVRGE
jgi:hypothetical protein